MEVDALGGAELRVMQEVMLAAYGALKNIKTPLVPSVTMGGNGEGNNALETYAKMLNLNMMQSMKQMVGQSVGENAKNGDSGVNEDLVVANTDEIVEDTTSDTSK